MTTLAKLIFTRRVHLGLSLQKLADATNLSKGHCHDLEKGRTTDIKVSTAIALASALQVTLTTVIEASVKSIGVAENTKPPEAKQKLKLPFQFRCNQGRP